MKQMSFVIILVIFVLNSCTNNGNSSNGETVSKNQTTQQAINQNNIDKTLSEDMKRVVSSDVKLSFNYPKSWGEIHIISLNEEPDITQEQQVKTIIFTDFPGILKIEPVGSQAPFSTGFDNKAQASYKNRKFGNYGNYDDTGYIPVENEEKFISAFNFKPYTGDVIFQMDKIYQIYLPDFDNQRLSFVIPALVNETKYLDGENISNLPNNITKGYRSETHANNNDYANTIIEYLDGKKEESDYVKMTTDIKNFINSIEVIK